MKPSRLAASLARGVSLARGAVSLSRCSLRLSRRAPRVACALALGLAPFLAGCPDPGKGSATPSPVASPTPSATGTPAPAGTPATVATTWVGQAEKVIARLEEVVRLVEAGDRPAALALREKAYFEDYENPDRHLEAASKRYLPEEPFEGKPRNVVIAREDAFASIKAAVKGGAPAAKVKELVGALSAQIREDARKLDAQNAAPP